MDRAPCKVVVYGRRITRRFADDDPRRPRPWDAATRTEVPRVLGQVAAAAEHTRTRVRERARSGERAGPATRRDHRGPRGRAADAEQPGEVGEVNERDESHALHRR
jgi:hypothetical protein